MSARLFKVFQVHQALQLCFSSRNYHLLIMASKRSSRFPCGKCARNCASNCIRCEVCCKWFHGDCEQISSDELRVWSSVEWEYICVSCRSENGDINSFDYMMGIHRLSKVSVHIYNV